MEERLVQMDILSNAQSQEGIVGNPTEFEGSNSTTPSIPPVTPTFSFKPSKPLPPISVGFNPPVISTTYTF